MEQPILLKAENISHDYQGKTVIEEINLSIKQQEVVSLLGVSGVGKSTLFHILSGLLIPKTGKVLLHQEEITGKPGNVSYMLQKDLLLPHYTVLENLILPKRLKKVSKKKAREEVKKLLPEFGLEACENLYPSQLSGGMRQRVALLRTYLFSKEVMLLDEPFSALDALTKSELHNWYLQILEKMKMSVFMITHDIEEAILLSDRIYIMAGKPGKIITQLEIKKTGQDKQEYGFTKEFLEYKKQIRELLG